MKGIVLTERNINQIHGILKRFFFNNASSGFSVYKSLDSGKKRVRRLSYLFGEGIDTAISYPAPLSVVLEDNRITAYFGAIDFTIALGDKISFKSNRIIVKTKGYVDAYTGRDRNLYTVFCMKYMSEEEMDFIRSRFSNSLKDFI